METNKLHEWWRAAAVRMVKTAAQGALGAIGSAAILGDVNWLYVLSTAVLAAIVSGLMSVAGLPEVEDGTSALKLAEQDEKED